MMFFNWLFYCIAAIAVIYLLVIIGPIGIITLLIGGLGYCLYVLVGLEEEE